MAEDTLATIERETKATSTVGFPSVSNLAVLGQNAMICRSELRDQSDLYLLAELRPIHLSQSLTFVAQDILPPFKERRRQQTQVASRQSKFLSTLGPEPDVLTVQEPEATKRTFIYCRNSDS